MTSDSFVMRKASKPRKSWNASIRYFWPTTLRICRSWSLTTASSRTRSRRPTARATRARTPASLLWTKIATTPDIHFETERIMARGDRGIIQWRLVWGPDHSSSVRGVNLMRVRAGRIVEAQGYVKGT